MARGAAAAAKKKKKNKRKGSTASGRGPAPKRARSSGPVVWSGSEASTSGAGGASGSGSSKSTATRESPALKALGRVDEERERERREEFLRSLEGLEGLSDEDRDAVVESALVTLKEMFNPMAPQDELREKLFDAAVTVARDKSKSDADKIRVNAPFASALAVPTETSITMILQWPRKFASHVKEMTVDEFSKDGCAEVNVETADWLAAMGVREGGEGGEERRCATGRVMEKLVAELVMTDEDGEESESTEKHHSVAWVDASEFAPAPDEEEYEKPRKDCDRKKLSPPAVFKDAARATAEVFSQAIATGELKSKLVVVCGSVAVSTLLGALKRNDRLRLHKAAEASYAAYGLESEAVQLTSFSGMYVVRCDDGRVVFLIAFPALQELWPGSREGWKTFATGASTMITLMKTLAGRARWDAERVAEKGKGLVRSLGSLGGRRTVELGVGVHAGTAEERRENAAKGGRIGGRTTKERGVGIFAGTAEERRETAAKAGRTTKERGVGIFAGTAEERRENAAEAGRRTVELGVGIHAGRRAAQIKREAECLKVKQEFGTVISRGKQTVRYCELEFVLGPHHEKFMMMGTISSKGEWKATAHTNMYSVGPLLRRLKEFAFQTGVWRSNQLSAEYACERPMSLVFITGWYESPPFSDEIQRNISGSLGNLLRELVQKGVCEVRRKSPSAL